MALNANELVDYACIKFEEEKYNEALEAFILAYSKGKEQEWILDNIYSCYMAGNDMEFRQTYEKQAKRTNISYEDCLLDFIPYEDGKYYVFDKEEGIFRGEFSAIDLKNVEPDPYFRKMEFSAAVLEMEWDWNKDREILSEADRRKIYVICHDMKRWVSYYKIPELAEYMENITVFADQEEFQEYFHNNTSVYLPKIVCGTQQVKEKLYQIIEQEHQYRLTPEGRNTDNIILTIGIPTHERGHLLLKRLENLLPMQYDAEIEIAISKNGNKRYQREYKQIEEMLDARINYYDHGGEIHPTLNWSYVVEMAHGKYVLFVSDEDDVVVNSIEHYLKLFTDNPDLSLARAKTRFQVPVQERLYGEKGIEAFRCEFTRQNYLSGLIVKRQDFLEEDVLRLQKYSDNPYYQYYPHEWWGALLSQRGDYVQEPFLLIDEKESVAGEEARLAQEESGNITEEESWGENYVPDFATYKERLRQFKGQLELLHLLCKEDKEMAEAGIYMATGKTAWLFMVARVRNYAYNNYLHMMDEFVTQCIEAVEEFNLDIEQKKRLLQWVQECCAKMYECHVNLLNGCE